MGVPKRKWPDAGSKFNASIYPDRMNKQLHTGEGMNEQKPVGD